MTLSKLEAYLDSSVASMVFGPPPWRDPLLCVKTVHPEFTTEDLRKLSEAPRADGAGVYPVAAGPGKEVFESINIWNPQCEDYSFEVCYAPRITKTGMNRSVLHRNCDSSIRISVPQKDSHCWTTFLEPNCLLQLWQRVIFRLRKN